MSRVVCIHSCLYKENRRMPVYPIPPASSTDQILHPTNRFPHHKSTSNLDVRATPGKAGTATRCVCARVCVSHHTYAPLPVSIPSDSTTRVDRAPKCMACRQLLAPSCMCSRGLSQKCVMLPQQCEYYCRVSFVTAPKHIITVVTSHTTHLL